MITIIKPGMQMSIQDQGRTGSRHLGIGQSGCIDPYAQVITNRLVGNDDNNPVIEITLGLAEIKFDNDYYIALHGTDMKATVNGNPVDPGWSFYIKKGDVLKFNAARHGFRSYLAIGGEWHLPEPILDSYSTDILAGFGGLNGQALQAGDSFDITPRYNTKIGLGAMLPPKSTQIRIHAAPHAALLPKETIVNFINHSWHVSPNSNRMGTRLLSDECDISHDVSLPSMAVAPGCIQLPPNGEPIVLLNDAQTTGGYPLLGTVIEADLRHFAQLKPGDFLHFKFVTLNEAHEAQEKLTAHLNQLAIALNYINK